MFMVLTIVNQDPVTACTCCTVLLLTVTIVITAVIINKNIKNTTKPFTKSSWSHFSSICGLFYDRKGITD